MSAVSADRVARSFRRSFASYHAATAPQARIADHLAERLAALGAPARFAQGFEIGCGTGHNLPMLGAFGNRGIGWTIFFLTGETELTAK